jgi:hypothetical protein
MLAPPNIGLLEHLGRSGIPEFVLKNSAFCIAALSSSRSGCSSRLVLMMLKLLSLVGAFRMDLLSRAQAFSGLSIAAERLSEFDESQKPRPLLLVRC